MYRGAVRKTVFILASSTVVVNSKDVISSDSSEKSLIEKLKTSIFGDNDKISTSTPVVKPEKSLIEKLNTSIFGDNDKLPTSTPVVKPEDNLTGWDRLTIMYTRDEFGDISKELNAVLYSLYTSVIVGGIYGTLIKTKEAYTEFIERNQATQFPNVFEARRKLQDKVMLAGLKGGFKYAMHLGFFTGGLLCCSVTMMVYFDKSSVLFYSVSAGAMGALHRWRYGLRGMYVGGIVGTLLGFLAGGLTKGLFVMTGKSMDDILTFQSSALQVRNKQCEKVIQDDKDSHNEYLPLLKDHSILISESKEEETDKIEPDKKTSAET